MRIVKADTGWLISNVLISCMAGGWAAVLSAVRCCSRWLSLAVKTSHDIKARSARSDNGLPLHRWISVTQSNSNSQHYLHQARTVNSGGFHKARLEKLLCYVWRPAWLLGVDYNELCPGETGHSCHISNKRLLFISVNVYAILQKESHWVTF